MTDTQPTRLASSVGIVAAVIASVLVAPYSATALGFCVVGLAVLAGSLWKLRQGATTIGAVSIFAGILFAGLQGAPELLLLLSGAGTVLAWDSIYTAIGLGTQLATETQTKRVEIVHVTASGLVGLGSVLGAFTVYTTNIDGPAAAVLLFSLAVVLIATGLR
jgi:hypothetical protein